MRQPPRYESTTQPNFVCRLKKALYGLKQAPRACHSRLTSKLLELGFKASKADTSLYSFHQGGVTRPLFQSVVTSTYPSLVFHNNNYFRNSTQNTCVEATDIIRLGDLFKLQVWFAGKQQLAGLKRHHWSRILTVLLITQIGALYP